jgi:hypothetical protein
MQCTKVGVTVSSDMHAAGTVDRVNHLGAVGLTFNETERLARQDDFGEWNTI